MSPRTTSLLSGVVAALVPVADSAFGWHLQPAVVLGIIMGLLGIIAAEVGHAHVSATERHTAVLQGVESTLQNTASLLSEVGKQTATAASTGKAS